MYVPFSSLPPSSRVWIFQTNRPLSSEELALAEEGLRRFTDSWTVHGSPLNASFHIEFNQFMIIAADESQGAASGCSIDSSVRALKEIGEALGVDLFDRKQVAFRLGEQVQLIPLEKVKEKFTDGTLNGDSLTFNNLVSTKSELETDWLTPVSRTWLKRYLPSGFVEVK